jgi:hypothetical protein
LKVFGRTTKRSEEYRSSGMEATRDHTRTIADRERASFSGKMENSMSANGSKAISTVKAFGLTQGDKAIGVNGGTAKLMGLETSSLRIPII